MNAKTYDWKDVANSQFDKAFTLALLLLLFAIMVTPRVDIKRQKFSMEQMQAVELPPEEREEIKPPEDIVKPVIDIVISEDLTGKDASDIDLKADALKLFGQDIYSTNLQSKSGQGDKPFEFVPYEDPPEPINPIAPEYPEHMIKMGYTGVVILEVDVYKDGTVGKIDVKKSLLKGTGGLDEAAINTVKKWKFQPGKSGGKPIDTTVIIPIEFNIKK
ncbi:MAG: energy transducer TonB [Candidatus Cloacimonetes bacterium]|nr:energy transducer TonB [Candidatus Cloacimonadota bacterium]